MIENQIEYVDVILPLPLPGLFTYAVPPKFIGKIAPGMRVTVPFGARKLMSGIVRRLKQEEPAREVKPVMELLDTEPIVDNTHLEFWDWISSYYLCHPGEVISAALPSTLKPSTETLIMLNHDFSNDSMALNEKELALVTLLRKGPMTQKEASDSIGLAKISPLLMTMQEKGLIRFQENMTGLFKPKTDKRLRISENLRDDEQLQQLFETLERRAVKQLEALMSFIHKFGVEGDVSKKEFLESMNMGPHVIAAMVSKGIFSEEEVVVSRFESRTPRKDADNISFSEEQVAAMERIKEAFVNQQTVLLHGVTGSGKTEMYIHLISEIIKRDDRQVLYLVPEIALTSQLVGRLQEYFGDLVAVYHSRHNNQERAEVWNSIRRKQSGVRIVLGARSAIFLPFLDLGLIIVDEEHDGSYKQHDPAPRYHARDAAVYLSKKSGANIILGSATPSVESYFNAQQDRFTLVELKKRFGGATMPSVIVVDMEEAYRKHMVKSHFSTTLVESVKEALYNKQQIILFQNRRGFSLRLECQHCQWMPQCRNCDVTLVYHKGINKLVCHYCGFQQPLFTKCLECNSHQLQLRGFGTEKIEEELPLFFPDARIKRMDLDTTRGKQAHAKALEEFGSGKVNILVGTQMVTKGLDFDNVAVVGILNADNMLKFPDFRSGERSFQHFAQVSGRAGRKNNPGIVVIQTYDPSHPIIRQVISNDYLGMFKDQVLERRNFKYPPFIRLIRILLLHRNLDKLSKAAVNLGIELRKVVGENRVLGPEFPLITRLRNLHQKQIMVKLDRSPNMQAQKLIIKDWALKIERNQDFKGLRIIIDVDPQ